MTTPTSFVESRRRPNRLPPGGIRENDRSPRVAQTDSAYNEINPGTLVPPPRADEGAGRFYP